MMSACILAYRISLKDKICDLGPQIIFGKATSLDIETVISIFINPLCTFIASKNKNNTFIATETNLT